MENEDAVSKAMLINELGLTKAVPKDTLAGNYVRGIDVSSFCGKIDFAKLKESNYGNFVIIRVGWGQNYTQQDDSRISEYARGCEKNGIPYGIYLYSYADTKEKAKSEMKHCLRCITDNKLKPTLGVWLDIEDTATYKKTFKNQYSKSCREFLEWYAIQWYGFFVGRCYDAGVYASEDYWKNVLLAGKNNSLIFGLPKWVANWSKKKPPTGYKLMKMWQYKGSDSGIVVPGTKCGNDLNVWTGKPIK